MKLNKYLLGLAVVAMGGLTACNTDVEGEFYHTNFDNVSFEVANKSVSLPNTTDNVSIPVRVTRGNTAAAYTAHYTSVASHEGIFSDDANGTVTFEQGQGSAVINISANKLEKEVSYTYTLTLSEQDVNTADTIVNNQNSAITISVQREGDWISLGKGLYREDIMSTWWTVDNLEYELEIRESEYNKGIYRVMNPYGEAYDYNDPGDWDDSKDYYIEINAQDPDFVWIPSCELGVDWGYGMINIMSYVQYYIDGGNSLEDIKAARPDLFGKLKDGVITMPVNSILQWMPDLDDGGLYYGNTNGMFRVALPGAVIADYSAEVEYTGTFTNTQGEFFAVGNLTLGPDVNEAKAVVVEADADASAVADAIAAGDLEGTDVEAGTIYVPIPEDLNGKIQLVVVVIDDGEVKNVASDEFEFYGGGKNPWKSLGKGYLTDDFVITQFYETYDEETETGTVFEPKTYEVEFMESTEAPGVYRMIDAFQGVTQYVKLNYNSANIDINASDPEAVYIDYQKTGLDDGKDEIAIITYGYYLYKYGNEEGYSLDAFKSAGFLGKLADGVITFPSFDSKYGPMQSLTFFGTSGYYSGMNEAIKIVLPTAVQSVKNFYKAKAIATAKRIAAERVYSYPYTPAKKSAKKSFNKKMLKKAQPVVF